MKSLNISELSCLKEMAESWLIYVIEFDWDNQTKLAPASFSYFL